MKLHHQDTKVHKEKIFIIFLVLGGKYFGFRVLVSLLVSFRFFIYIKLLK